jgi:hypothetical protein
MGQITSHDKKVTFIFLISRFFLLFYKCTHICHNVDTHLALCFVYIKRKYVYNASVTEHYFSNHVTLRL